MKHFAKKHVKWEEELAKYININVRQKTDRPVDYKLNAEPPQRIWLRLAIFNSQGYTYARD